MVYVEDEEDRVYDVDDDEMEVSKLHTSELKVEIWSDEGIMVCAVGGVELHEDNVGKIEAMILAGLEKECEKYAEEQQK